MALYLIPTPLGAEPPDQVLAPQVLETVRTIRHFAVEQLPWARRFLDRIGHPVPAWEIGYHELSKKTKAEHLAPLLKLLGQGEHVGVISEAGSPGVADPGAGLAWICHQRNIPVVPLAGPSAVLLAVMGSGFTGQRFCFGGYLPIHPTERVGAIRKWERRSAEWDEAQFLIEAPHRNVETWKALVETLEPETRLGYALGFGREGQSLLSLPVHVWKNRPAPVKDGVPAMFGFYAG